MTKSSLPGELGKISFFLTLFDEFGSMNNIKFPQLFVITLFLEWFELQQSAIDRTRQANHVSVRLRTLSCYHDISRSIKSRFQKLKLCYKNYFYVQFRIFVAKWIFLFNVWKKSCSFTCFFLILWPHASTTNLARVIGLLPLDTELTQWSVVFCKTHLLIVIYCYGISLKVSTQLIEICLYLSRMISLLHKMTKK